MPDGSLSWLEEQFNKIVKAGTGGLRGVNAGAQAESGLAGAIKSFLEKQLKDNPEARLYIDDMSKQMAKAIVHSEPMDMALRAAQQTLAEVASYLDDRLLIAPKMQATALGVAGQNVSPAQLAAVQGAVTSQAMQARSLDANFRTKVEQKFSVNPGVVLDSTVLFVQKIDASYQVTITSADVTVRLRTGFTIQKPLTSHAGADVNAGVELQHAGLTAFVRGTTSIEDLYARSHVSKSGVSAGMSWNISQNASLNLDYHINSSYGAHQHVDQGVFLGIKIRF
jgi:hypothetical protein